MLDIRNTLREIKNSSDGLINTLNESEERTDEIKKHREKKNI